MCAREKNRRKRKDKSIEKDKSIILLRGMHAVFLLLVLGCVTFFMVLVERSQNSNLYILLDLGKFCVGAIGTILLTIMLDKAFTIFLIKREKVDNESYSYYKELLRNKSYLIVSNVLLTLALVYTLPKVLKYSLVEFIAYNDVDVYVTKPEENIRDNIKAIAHIEKGKLARLRLEVGANYIMYRVSGDTSIKNFHIIEPFNVDYIWKEQRVSRINLIKSDSYEVIGK